MYFDNHDNFPKKISQEVPCVPILDYRSLGQAESTNHFLVLPLCEPRGGTCRMTNKKSNNIIATPLAWFYLLSLDHQPSRIRKLATAKKLLQ